MAKRKNKKKANNDFVYVFLLAIFILFVLYFNFDKISNLVNISTSEPSRVNIKEILKKKSISDAIAHSKELLGIKDKYYKHQIRNEVVHISLGIDRKEMDMNYANMILSGQIELIGGVIISGTEKNNRQILEYLDPADSQKFVVTIYYIRSNTNTEKKIKLAIVVDDFGIHNDELLDDFCSLDKNITFAILPDQKYSKIVMLKAAKTGHETMIHIPMEPVSYPRNNPGPNAIYVHLSEREIKKRIGKFIKQLPLCVGANNHMGSLATTDKGVMKTVLKVLKDNELYFVDSRTTQSSIAYDVAKKMMMPTFRSNLFLDTPNISEKTLKTKIAQLKALSKKRDKILVITHCATRERYIFLKSLIEKIEDMNFELVPVSKLFESNLPEIL